MAPQFLTNFSACDYICPLTRCSTTTRAVRKRLDFDRPVEREVMMECLEIALQAPTGSNRQGWQWLFVEDSDKKRSCATSTTRTSSRAACYRGRRTLRETRGAAGMMPSSSRRTICPRTSTACR